MTEQFIHLIVYCYYAEDTVERNILDLAARQGLSLYTKDNSSGTLNVEPLKAAMRPTDKNEVDAPSKKVQKGDFVFKYVMIVGWPEHST